MKILLTIFAVSAISSLAQARELMWSSDSLDPFGYTTLSEFHLSSSIASSFTLIDRNPEKARTEFSKLLVKGDNDIFVIYGYLLASRKCDKSLDALEVVAKHYAEFRANELKGGIRASQIPVAYLIGYSLGLSFLKNDATQGQVENYDKFGKVSRYYFGELSNTMPDLKRLDRSQILLLGGSYQLRGLTSEARKIFQTYSSSHPKDFKLHLMLCRAYGTGTYKLFDAHGREKPIPDGDKIREDLAKREAMAAWKLAPNSPITNYYAGYYSQSDNPAFTKKCWKIYLDSPLAQKKPNKTTEFVIQWMKSH